MGVEQDILSQVALGADDVAFLRKLVADLPILADVSRADLLLYCRSESEGAVTVAQAMPHSVSPLYEGSRVGLRVTAAEQPEVMHALASGGAYARKVYTVDVRGATVARQVLPVRNAWGRLTAVLAMDSYWLAYERQVRRSKVFQEALRIWQSMVLRGELQGADGLTPFGAHDGVVYVGADRRILYMSGIAAGLYRDLGYRDSLVGQRVGELETVDVQMVNHAISDQVCSERQDEQYGLTWVRRAIPLVVQDEPFWARWSHPASQRAERVRGVFILISDMTEVLRTQRELESKMAMIREVHHRVKNNLQVIASLLRMQARRVSSAEARTALEESVNRILSVAVVHEFLSQNAKGTINLLDVARRILGQVQQGLVDPSKRIQLTVSGPDIWLPAERATQCALVVNELVQNAIEHGMPQRDEGSVVVKLIDEGEKVSIIVADDGEGLPGGFDLDANANLGLRIVRSMVERDLRGTFELLSEHGTRASVHFDKSALGGGS